MHSLVAYTLLASATLSVALDPRFEFPDTVPLHKRQQPGTPQYACHEDCGLLITLGREKGFCDNDEWHDHYGKCMECANTYGIWKYYGNAVSKAAKECGLSPTPSPSGSTGAASTKAEEKPSSTAVKQPVTTEAEEPKTTEVEEPKSATTAAPEETEGSEHTSTEAHEHSEAENTTLATHASATTHAANPTETHAHTEAGHTSVDEVGTIGIKPTSTPLPSSVVVNGAPKQFGFTTAMVVAVMAMCGLY
ncbi:hypothetical protein F53441_9563 [Fusarium austroafricanum]|uniref:Uncharacterized protein n=1 Tax=Fusarium austroafricanum TaxID=2364996 RepID=A0A8H4KD82_9HYPO|nr:hypothetical protein F53441_9563 [Fusarium austroafricanum]